MSYLNRLFGKTPDEREKLRPLWRSVVALARARPWFAALGVADSREGRFDMVTLALAVVLLRMEREPGLGTAQASLTELFVEDMDGQLRQSGIGDPTVGKHVRKLVATLAGRLGALREALPQGEAALTALIARNVTLLDGADPAPLARRVAAMHAALRDTAADVLLAGRIAYEPA